jgi:hypothetical protein
MREKFIPLIKFCAIRTVPSTVTKSVGLAADVSWFLQTLSRLFRRDPKLTILTWTWYRLDSFIVTQDFSVIYQDLQKPRHRDADGT